MHLGKNANCRQHQLHLSGHSDCQLHRMSGRRVYVQLAYSDCLFVLRLKTKEALSPKNSRPHYATGLVLCLCEAAVWVPRCHSVETPRLHSPGLEYYIVCLGVHILHAILTSRNWVADRLHGDCASPCG